MQNGVPPVLQNEATPNPVFLAIVHFSSCAPLTNFTFLLQSENADYY
jgi:hypothetical protein